MVLSTLTDRLQHAEISSHPTQHSDDPEVIQQRLAVKNALEILKKYSNIPGSSIFSNLRVADSLGQGKTEIDIIIVSGWKIDCLMVRNWSGKITKDSEQDKFTIEDESKNTIKQFDNPIKEAQRRANLVRTYLNQSGIALKDYHTVGRLVLTNIELLDLSDGMQVFNDSSVIRDIETYAESYVNTWFWTFADPVIPSLLSGSISYSQLTDIHLALAKLGTFDVAFLTGGRKIIGDFVSNSSVHFSRSEVEEIEIEKVSLGIIGRVKSAVGFFPEVTCKLYRRGGQGWFFRSKHSTILVPYNVTVPFRIAGENQEALIPIYEILRIVISK